MAVNSHALPVHKRNRITSLLTIFETAVIVLSQKANVFNLTEAKVQNLVWKSLIRGGFFPQSTVSDVDNLYDVIYVEAYSNKNTVNIYLGVHALKCYLK